MRDFYQQRFNMLLCTTIIETGIDIPSANTIIINRADSFGLAQLHQLRGRVGRSHHQAYAYLLMPDEGAVTSNARKRLEAIQMMEELGSGFYLAMHDLEIRGAGEVLGESQSGQMQEIGFKLYTRDAQRRGEVAQSRQGARSRAAARRSLPRSICTRRRCCRRPTAPTFTSGWCSTSGSPTARTLDELEALQEELVDRFGLLPEPAQDAARQPSPAHRSQAARHLQGGRRTRDDRPAIHQRSADRLQPHHWANPDAAEFQAVGTGSAARRRETPKAGRARSTRTGDLPRVDSARACEGRNAMK